MRLLTLLAVLLAACLLSFPAHAASTDTAAINITVNDTYYVALTAGADWTYTIVEADFLNGYAVSGSLVDVMDIAGNAAYEITAQMSAATWDAGVTLQIDVEAAGWTSLNDSTATVITGLASEVAGNQDDLDLEWRLNGITWANTDSSDDWTCTVTLTCQADT